MSCSEKCIPSNPAKNSTLLIVKSQKLTEVVIRSRVLKKIFKNDYQFRNTANCKIVGLFFISCDSALYQHHFSAKII